MVAAEGRQVFLWIALILITARVSSLIERWGQPAVLGELLVGVLLGNLTLVGIHALTPIRENHVIEFLAELGVVILLFPVGLESNIREMGKVGMRALAVATLGVVLPLVTGTHLIAPLFLPGLAFNAYLFLDATGQRLGIVSDEVFGVIIIGVILSTLLAPPILTYVIRRSANSAKNALPA